jgi:glutathione peroxidase
MLFTGSIYSITVKDTKGANIQLGDYQHKKSLLIVNIATGNTARAGQLAGLQQLQQQFEDSLVVIVFPSNSFGNENLSNEELLHYCRYDYNSTFLVAAKGSVDSTDIQPLYNWLTKKTGNGIMDNRVRGDFQKYIIDPNGNLTGVFAGSVLPSDSSLISAIKATF